MLILSLVYSQPYRQGRCILRKEEVAILSVGSNENPEEVKKRFLSEGVVKDFHEIHGRKEISWTRTQLPVSARTV